MGIANWFKSASEPAPQRDADPVSTPRISPNADPTAPVSFASRADKFLAGFGDPTFSPTLSELEQKSASRPTSPTIPETIPASADSEKLARIVSLGTADFESRVARRAKVLKVPVQLVDKLKRNHIRNLATAGGVSPSLRDKFVAQVSWDNDTQKLWADQLSRVLCQYAPDYEHEHLIVLILMILQEMYNIAEVSRAVKEASPNRPAQPSRPAAAGPVHGASVLKPGESLHSERTA